MSTTDTPTSTDIMDTCANCGKEGSDLNICNKCKAATYCNAACKKKHRKKHKKKCEIRVAELHDEALFKVPLPPEDCPICFLRLPSMESGSKYCGKTYCSGCCHAPVYDTWGNIISGRNCPFCRDDIIATASSNKTMIEIYTKRVEKDDTQAMSNLGHHYNRGRIGLPRDTNKAMELWRRAAELGNSNANLTLGCKYNSGEIVERDIEKATYYWELAAMGGEVDARYSLGWAEGQAGNWDRSLKHFMLAAGGGSKESLSTIQVMFKRGVATKEDYTQALRAYQAYLAEIKSTQRDEASAFCIELYKYY